MGMWYKRSEAQKRFSFFFSSTTLAGAFGGLLAYGLGQMDGLRGYRGWRWVFIIEGVITAVVAIAWFFLLPDLPEDVKWLTKEEREYLRAKLARDTGRSATEAKITFRDVVNVFKDCGFCLQPTPLSLRCLTEILQTKSSLAVSCISARSSLPTVSCRQAYLVQADRIGYAYFAPTIINTYGYDRMSSSNLKLGFY